MATFRLYSATAAPGQRPRFPVLGITRAIVRQMALPLNEAFVPVLTEFVTLVHR